MDADSVTDILSRIGSLRKLGKEIGYSHSTISRKLQGVSGMSAAFAKKVAEVRPVKAQEVMMLPLLVDQAGQTPSVEAA